MLTMTLPGSRRGWQRRDGEGAPPGSGHLASVPTSLRAACPAQPRADASSPGPSSLLSRTGVVIAVLSGRPPAGGEDRRR